tara:strand:- start:3970 stop:4743 length:774 start_codon:yes stop_codon:yes gene_type:complete
MSYITKSHAIEACKKMQVFYSNLFSLYNNFELDLEENRGRRNILMSQPMEHFLAESLRKSFKDVINDGRTGKADIIIKDDKKEIEVECKLTSPHSSGTIAFQSDYETLEKKGSLDYVYIVANETFDEFCVIHFEGLTTDDFRKLSPGARGKVQMYKYKGMKKATVLYGNVVNNQDIRREKLEQKILDVSTSSCEKIMAWTKKSISLSEGRKYEKKKLVDQVQRLHNKTNLRINKILEDINILNTRKPSYTIKFKELK